LLTGKTVEIGGLIVDKKYRRKGVGRLLMKKSEEWGKSNGCDSVLLATQVKRSEAHLFYSCIGYQVEFQTYFMRKHI